MYPTKAKFDKYVKYGLVRKAENNRGLTIYVYSDFVVQERLWNEVTETARGIVFDEDGEIVQYCFRKFFNYNEPDGYRELSDRKIEYEEFFRLATPFEKIDGSLIKITKHNKYGLIITSKGSFTSEQVDMAKEILAIHPEYIDALEENSTYLFELIHPNNRIVINYGEVKDLKLLGVINSQGVEAPINYIEKLEVPFPKAKRIKNLEAYMKKKNIEGVVLNYEDLFRLKMKTDEYIKQHRFITGFTVKKVWKMLQNGVNPLEESYPEEFESWLYKTIAWLKDDFNQIYADLLKKKVQTDSLSDKELGLSSYKDKALIFSLRKGLNIDQEIWKLVKEVNGDFKNAKNYF